MEEEGLNDIIIKKFLEQENQQDQQEDDEEDQDDQEDDQNNMIDEQILNNEKQNNSNITNNTNSLIQTGSKPEDSKAEKQKQKRLRKKKKKDEDPLTDWEGDIDEKVKKSRLLDCVEIPEHVRFKYAHIEANPYNMILTNFPPTASSEEIREYFNTLILHIDARLFNPPPIKNVEIGTTKSFCVLTFSTKDARAIIKQIKELEYSGFKMQIKKPQVFFKKMTTRQTWNEEDKPEEQDDNMIYMGGLPLYLKDEDVRKLCETFGPLKSFNLVKDNSAQVPTSKGYCFFEYLDAIFADKAIKGLNGLPCGDKRLKVNKASYGSKNQQQKNGKNKPIPSNYQGSFLAGCDLIKNSSVQEMLNLPKFSNVPSRVIQFLNMVSPEDLFDDDIYQELYEDVQEECQVYGQVEKIEIPRPDFDTGLSSPQIGKIFVKFKYIIPAKRARHFLSGRTYNKRIVFVSFYPEDRFEIKDFLVSF